MDLKKLYHKNWSDILSFTISSSNLVIRSSGNKDQGIYKINDNLLLINWNIWGKEYFYLRDEEYYQLTDNYNFDLDKYISNIYLIDEDISDLYLLDIKLKKIYKKHNLDLFGSYELSPDKIIINKKHIYIYFNNKYYNSTFINKLYNIIYLNENEHTINYLLSKDSNVCYENYNIFIKNTM